MQWSVLANNNNQFPTYLYYQAVQKMFWMCPGWYIAMTNLSPINGIVMENFIDLHIKCDNGARIALDVYDF